MKNIKIKEHMVLFIAAIIIFAQFIGGIVFAYMLELSLNNAANFSFGLYFIYCSLICLAIIIFMVKTKYNYAKIWLSVMFIYAFFEVLYCLKCLLSGFTLESFYEGQPYFRLFGLLASLIIIYFWFYTQEKSKKNEKKNGFIFFGLVNLCLISIIIMFEPDAIYPVSSDVLDILAYAFQREASLIIIFANYIGAGLYKLYKL